MNNKTGTVFPDVTLHRGRDFYELIFDHRSLTVQMLLYDLKLTRILSLMAVTRSNLNKIH